VYNCPNDERPTRIAEARMTTTLSTTKPDPERSPNVAPDPAGHPAGKGSREEPAAAAVSGSRFLDWGDWRKRLALIDEMMRDMSRQTDPQGMVQSYGARLRQLMPTDRFVSLSRRDLARPWFRITRSSTWPEMVDPWKQPQRLPLLEGGLLSDLIYSDEPQLIDDIRPLLADDDPARPYLAGMRSLMAIPHYDRGVTTNMVLLMRKEAAAFDPDQFPEWVWVSSLFGRATQNLVLGEELKQTYAIVERELKVVADIQRSLLPQNLPTIPTLELATFYQTSRWAGGDYYDFFPLPDGRWGILIADVSGHGTPAAVIMAITHSLAHGHPGHPEPPSAMLEHVNRRLTDRYTNGSEVFVTAFYGIYDPETRTLSYACAGHNPPRLRRCRNGEVHSLEAAGGPPLGLFGDLSYGQATIRLEPNDVLMLYTDGITEAMDGRNQQFGLERLDAVLARCDLDAPSLVRAVLESVAEFSGGRAAEDDQTLIVAKVS
jgi:sigma-B regulation protein RsbU (phosphoserine phosphatase)